MAALPPARTPPPLPRTGRRRPRPLGVSSSFSEVRLLPAPVLPVKPWSPDFSQTTRLPPSHPKPPHGTPILPPPPPHRTHSNPSSVAVPESLPSAGLTENRYDFEACALSGCWVGWGHFTDSPGESGQRPGQGSERVFLSPWGTGATAAPGARLPRNGAGAPSDL